MTTPEKIQDAWAYLIMTENHRDITSGPLVGEHYWLKKLHPKRIITNVKKSDMVEIIPYGKSQLLLLYDLFTLIFILILGNFSI